MSTADERGEAPPEGEPPRGTPRVGPSPPVIALASAILIGALVHARAWSFLCDDAYISFRYADHLARFGALEYNLGERVEGYTDLLWVLLLGAGERVGVAPEALAPWLTGAAALTGLALAVLLLRRLRGRPGAPWGALDLAPAALLAAAPEWMVWANGGLETSLAAALVLGSTLAWTARRWILAAGLAGLAGLCRADALVPIAAFGAAWIALSFGTWRRGQAKIPARDLAAAALVFVALVGGQLLFRRLYYGAWLPNTWAVKAHGALLRGTYGVWYLEAWARGIGLALAAPLLLLLRARHLQVVAPALAALAYAYSVGGDFMAYSRFLAVATALVAIAVGWLLGDAHERLRRALRAPRRPSLRPLLRGATSAPLALTLAAALALAVAAHRRWEADRAAGQRWIDGRWEGVTAMDRFARVRVDVGGWMREHLPEGTWITVGAAGALPYASRLPAIDAYGLVDPAIAAMPEVRPQTGPRARPGHQLQAPTAYLRGRDPDLYCHAGLVADQRPPPASAGRRGLGRDLVWACVDRSAAAPAIFYCCLRPRDRIVGPFGAPAEATPGTTP